ncbi:MAG: hypothetical protein ACI4AA_02595 [Lachnospiraceae bacterium]
MLRDEIAENKEKMKDKSKWERFKYFWYYHWKPIFLSVIIVCGIISYILHFIEESKEPSISVSVVNCNIISEEETDLVSAYALSRNIDTSVNPTKLDVNLQMSENRNDNLDVANSQKLSAFLENGSIDVLFAPEWVMESCATQAYLENIETVLPEDLYERFEDRLIYHTYEDDGRVPIAIYVGDIDKIADIYDEDAEPYMAIGNFSSRQDVAVDFLRYLLED